MGGTMAGLVHHQKRIRSQPTNDQRRNLEAAPLRQPLDNHQGKNIHRFWREIVIHELGRERHQHDYRHMGCIKRRLEVRKRHTQDHKIYSHQYITYTTTCQHTKKSKRSHPSWKWPMDYKHRGGLEEQLLPCSQQTLPGHISPHLHKEPLDKRVHIHHTTLGADTSSRIW